MDSTIRSQNLVILYDRLTPARQARVVDRFIVLYPDRLVKLTALWATAATNALSHHADIAQVQEWLGHATLATPRRYDKRKSRPEDRPTFRVAY